jgi:perosamine synthetase
MIPIHKPFLPPSSLKYAHDALDSGWISFHGKYVQMMQEKLQELLDVKYVLPVFNGTVACHLMAKELTRYWQVELKLSPFFQKLIVPNNVYVAAWNAFLFDRGDFFLIPVDADLNTWNYDLNLLDAAIKKYPDASVLVVHNIGNILNVPALQRKYPETLFVEDNCEGFLGTYEDKQTGTASFASAISFFSNKNITSGEGGAFITNDVDAYEFAKCVQGQGQSSKKFIHNELGYNYRITNVQAGLLVGQLEILPQIQEMKANIFETYRNHLKDREDVRMQAIPKETTHANWMFGVRIPKQKSFEAADAFFREKGIEVRPMFYSIKAHKHLQNHPDIWDGDCTNADRLNKECLILPSFPELSKWEQKHILKTLDEYLTNIE